MLVRLVDSSGSPEGARRQRRDRELRQLPIAWERNRERAGTAEPQPTLRRVRRHGSVSTLRRSYLRGLQRILQEDRAKGVEIRVPGRESLPR